MNWKAFFLGLITAAIISLIAMILIGCLKPTRPVDPNIKRCAQWICDGQVWPGDYTNCTCRED